jgi:hypothetical protein
MAILEERRETSMGVVKASDLSRQHPMMLWCSESGGQALLCQWDFVGLICIYGVVGHCIRLVSDFAHTTSRVYC